MIGACIYGGVSSDCAEILTFRPSFRENRDMSDQAHSARGGNPPRGHTRESWAAMRQIAEIIALPASVRQPEPKRTCIQDYRDGKSYVYFIGGESGPVKIGFSIAPRERLASMQMGSPVKLAILALVEGTVTDEKSYHARFAEHRSHGEWFNRHPELEELILSLRPLSIHGRLACTIHKL
jgi:hypothetical protein